MILEFYCTPHPRLTPHPLPQGAREKERGSLQGTREKRGAALPQRAREIRKVSGKKENKRKIIFIPGALFSHPNHETPPALAG